MSGRDEDRGAAWSFTWSFGRYLRARLPFVAFALAGIASCLLVLSVAGLALSFRVLIVVLLLASSALGLFAGYLRERNFWRELGGLSCGLDRSWQLPSLVETPDFAEAEVAYDALRVMGAAASDEVHASKRQLGEYRDYIELWVHEVKAPIASAQLAADGLPGPEASQLKEDLERIARDVEQALFFARSTSLERDFAISEFPLLPVAQRACKDNARFLTGRHCMPVFHIPEETLAFGDPKWLGFILSQLVANAAKYGATELRFSTWLAGGPVPGEESERSDAQSESGKAVAPAGEPLRQPADAASGEFSAVSSTTQTLYLELADNGIGIPAADVPRVFDRGFTGENGRSHVAATGMGLYLSAIMCQKMGLSIELASEQGVGTRVILGFPFDRRRLDDSSVR